MVEGVMVDEELALGVEAAAALEEGSEAGEDTAGDGDVHPVGEIFHVWPFVGISLINQARRLGVARRFVSSTYYIT